MVELTKKRYQWRVSNVISTYDKIFSIEPISNRQKQNVLLSRGDNRSTKRHQAQERFFLLCLFSIGLPIFLNFLEKTTYFVFHCR